MANEATEESKSPDSSKEKSKSKKWLIILILLALIIIIALIVIIFLLLRKPEQVPEVDGRATIVTKDNVEEVMEKLSEPVVAGYYDCQMNVEWYFENSTKPSYNAYVANSTANKYTVYFDVNLDDDGKLVYSSPYLPVGSELDNVQLTEELEAGTYPAVVTYHLVDEDKNELSTVAVKVTLFIEN